VACCRFIAFAPLAVIADRDHVGLHFFVVNRAQAIT